MFKHKRTVLALAATAFAALAVTACEPVDGTAVPTTQADKAPGLWISTTTPKPYVAPTTKLPIKADPYKSNGTWLVPGEIAPGSYKATPTSSRSAYVAVCADLRCDIDFDGNDHTGMIDNYLLDGSDYVVVPEYAASVQLRNVALTLVAS